MFPTYDGEAMGEYPSDDLYLYNRKIVYVYDSNGDISGMELNGVSYYFRKNIMGDVTHIIDANKNIVGEYKYDAWGNHEILVNENGVAMQNPIRYRSYYYDIETGLYYLKSRYYDPETGRFVSPDDIEILEESMHFVNGLNLYTYCGNNPIMRTDEDGNKWWKWVVGVVVVVGAVAVTVTTLGVGGAIIAGAGALVGGLVSGGLSVMNAGIGESKMGAFLGGFVNGAVSTIGLALGVATGGIGGLLIAGVTGFAGGYLGSRISQTITYGNVNSKVAFLSGGISALTNMLMFLPASQILSSVTGASFAKRFVDAIAPSMIIAGASVYLGTLPTFTMPDIRRMFDNNRFRVI